MAKVLREVFVVTIDNETGESTIDVQGSDGESCLKATSALERALGGHVKRVLKSEVYNRLVKGVRNTLNI